MPIQDHVEMGFSGENDDLGFDDLINKLENLEYYTPLFTLAYGTPEITEVKKIPVHEAIKLGLEDATRDDDGNERDPNDLVDIPSWRQAVINFPHPFLKQGLSILDTPGLNSLGNEPELTLSMLPSAQAVVFVLSADTGVTRSDMDIWQEALRNFRRKKTKNSLIIALNKIDTLWDDLKNLDAIN